MRSASLPVLLLLLIPWVGVQAQNRVSDESTVPALDDQERTWRLFVRHANVIPAP